MDNVRIAKELVKIAKELVSEEQDLKIIKSDIKRQAEIFRLEGDIYRVRLMWFLDVSRLLPHSAMPNKILDKLFHTFYNKVVKIDKRKILKHLDRVQDDYRGSFITQRKMWSVKTIGTTEDKKTMEKLLKNNGFKII